MRWRDPLPARADTNLGTRDPRGRGRRGPAGADYKVVPAAVTGLDAGPSRSPRAITDGGTAMTTGRKPAERVSPKGQFEETVGVDLG